MPIRPKDVANAYMHRFKYYIPNVSTYKCLVHDTERLAEGSHLYIDTCVTATEMGSINILDYHVLNNTLAFVKLRSFDILEGLSLDPDFELKVLQAHPTPSIRDAIIGAYCFDNFVINNCKGEGGNVLWAKHAYTPRWSVLTDLAAIGE